MYKWHDILPNRTASVHIAYSTRPPCIRWIKFFFFFIVFLIKKFPVVGPLYPTLGQFPVLLPKKLISLKAPLALVAMTAIAEKINK